EEQLVFDVVRVPDELPPQLHELDVEVVDGADRLGAPQLRKPRQLFLEVHLVHGFPIRIMKRRDRELLWGSGATLLPLDRSSSPWASRVGGPPLQEIPAIAVQV